MADVLCSPHVRELARRCAPASAPACERPAAILRPPLEEGVGYLRASPGERQEYAKGRTSEAFATSGASALAFTAGHACQVPSMFLPMPAACSRRHTLALARATSKMTCSPQHWRAVTISSLPQRCRSASASSVGTTARKHHWNDARRSLAGSATRAPARHDEVGRITDRHRRMAARMPAEGSGRAGAVDGED